jgi:hypothetical protein
MPGSIFVIGDDGALIEMRETPFDSEAFSISRAAPLPSGNEGRASIRRTQD